MKSSLRILSLALISFFLIAASACTEKKSSTLLKEQLKYDNLIDLTKQIKDDENMTREEIDLFSTGLARKAVIKDSIEGKTVSDIIEYEKEQRRLISYNSLLTKATSVEMNLALNVSFNNMSRRADTTAKQIYDILSITVENLSDKTIKGFGGALTLQIQNKNIKTINIHLNTQSVEPGQKLPLTIRSPYDKYSKAVYDLNAKKAKFISRWQPLFLEFDDGKKLELKIAGR